MKFIHIYRSTDTGWEGTYYIYCDNGYFSNKNSNGFSRRLNSEQRIKCKRRVIQILMENKIPKKVIYDSIGEFQNIIDKLK